MVCSSQQDDDTAPRNVRRRATTDAALSLLVLAGWAILVTAAAIRVFTRSAVN